MIDRDHEVQAGQRRARRLLGSVAVYRVQEIAGDTVEMVTEDVPGLPAGQVVRLTLAAVAEMEHLPD